MEVEAASLPVAILIGDASNDCRVLGLTESLVEVVVTTGASQDTGAASLGRALLPGSQKDPGMEVEAASLPVAILIGDASNDCRVLGLTESLVEVVVTTGASQDTGAASFGRTLLPGSQKD